MYLFRGDPWPSKRPDYDCFAGCGECCDQVDLNHRKNYTKVCPEQCRPHDHKDWIYC